MMQEARQNARLAHTLATDTALVEIGTTTAHETRELTPDLYVDLDAEGRVVSITIEHASRQGDLSEVTFEWVAVGPRAE
jgi:uncharacterized protein YuzE